MAKLVKKEGAIETCPTCKQQMVCVEINSKDGGPKLQWQNDKGESHYLPPTTGADGKPVFACRGYKVTAHPPTNIQTEVDFSNFSPEHVNADEQIMWNDIVAKSAEYAILAQKKLGEYPEIVNPALKGLITKIAFEVLTEFKRESRNE